MLEHESESHSSRRFLVFDCGHRGTCSSGASDLHKRVHAYLHYPIILRYYQWACNAFTRQLCMEADAWREPQRGWQAPGVNQKETALNPVVLLPDGVGIRNFLLGPFLKLLTQHGKPTVFHPIPGEMLPLYTESLNASVDMRPFLPYREDPLTGLLRYSASYAHFYHFNTRGMRHVRNLPIQGGIKMRAGRKLAKVTGRLLATAPGIAFLQRWQYRLAGKAEAVLQYRTCFSEIRPSILFCSHQRPIEAVPAVLAARSLGIPTAVFIFSWDNLSSKSRIVAPYDHYLVWSPLMKQEMGQFYPEVPPERVHIVGTPQFDPYEDPRMRMTREEFFHWLGADPTRPLICFSGSDIITAPDDQFHVDMVMQEIRAGNIKGRPQVVLRPAPVDSGKRFEEVRKKFPELIYKAPDWVRSRRGSWTGIVPLPADVKALANLTLHCDLNLNVSSTMTLDFALRDKPVVNIAFDVTQPPPFGVPLDEFHLRFEHYVPVVELGAARIARSRQELVSHINAYLHNPALDREARRRFVELEVGVPVGEASNRMVEALAQLAQTST